MWQKYLYSYIEVNKYKGASPEHILDVYIKNHCNAVEGSAYTFSVEVALTFSNVHIWLSNLSEAAYVLRDDSYNLFILEEPYQLPNLVVELIEILFNVAFILLFV